jgi:hypothetical protein
LFEKVPIQWQSDSLHFNELYTVLNQLRRDLPVLRMGDMKSIPALDGNSTQVYAFTREYKKQRAFVLINLSSVTQNYTLQILAMKGLKHRLMKCSMRTPGGYIEFRLPPYGYWVGTVDN